MTRNYNPVDRQCKQYYFEAFPHFAQGGLTSLNIHVCTNRVSLNMTYLTKVSISKAHFNVPFIFLTFMDNKSLYKVIISFVEGTIC